MIFQERRRVVQWTSQYIGLRNIQGDLEREVGESKHVNIEIISNTPGNIATGLTCAPISTLVGTTPDGLMILRTTQTQGVYIHGKISCTVF